ALYARLNRVDRDLARRLHAEDVRRVIRGIEVFELTGVALSQQQRQEPLPVTERPAHVYWLHPPRRWLYDRIDRRVEALFPSGLVTEVERLLCGEQPMGTSARQALGYKEVIDHLEGRLGLTEVVALLQTRTRQFAKRQHTWFRNLAECREVEISGKE